MAAAGQCIRPRVSHLARAQVGRRDHRGSAAARRDTAQSGRRVLLRRQSSRRTATYRRARAGRPPLGPPHPTTPAPSSTRHPRRSRSTVRPERRTAPRPPRFRGAPSVPVGRCRGGRAAGVRRIAGAGEDDLLAVRRDGDTRHVGAGIDRRIHVRVDREAHDGVFSSPWLPEQPHRHRREREPGKGGKRPPQPARPDVAFRGGRLCPPIGIHCGQDEACPRSAPRAPIWGVPDCDGLGTVPRAAGQRTDGGNEAIAAARKRLDERRALRIVVQGLSQQADRFDQRDLGDERVLPTRSSSVCFGTTSPARSTRQVRTPTARGGSGSSTPSRESRPLTQSKTNGPSPTSAGDGGLHRSFSDCVGVFRTSVTAAAIVAHACPSSLKIASPTLLARTADPDRGACRVLGRVDLVVLGIGAVIGAGIFVLTGQVAGAQRRARPSSCRCWSRAVVSALAGLCYAELRGGRARLRLRLHLRLRDARRAGGLDHRLGSGARVRAQRGDGRGRAGRGISRACCAISACRSPPRSAPRPARSSPWPAAIRSPRSSTCPRSCS